MSTKNRLPMLFGALLTMSLGAPMAASSVAEARDCGVLPASLTSDPLAGGLQVVSANKTFRVQERPWAHIPTGARVTVRAPAGVTEADLHRAALCGATESSPLSVPGAKLRVERAGDVYQLHVTADARSAAIEIQRRASAL